MKILGFSGLANSISFKRREFQGLSEREYNIVQGLDAAAALVGPEGVIAAAAEERFTRQKATNAFPVQAINYCLRAGKLNLRDIDFIAHGFAYEPHRSLVEADDYGRRQYEEVFSPESQRRLLAQHLGEHDKKLISVPHHLAHAASSFYLSGFEDSLILVSDGMGEVQSMTVAVGKGNDITELAQVSSFHSLGALYGVFTLYLGFFMNSDEYKVMGLAPYGNSRRFFNQIMEFVSLKPDGTYTIPLFAHNHSLEERETHRGVSRFLVEKFGPAREPESETTQLHKDIAAALQAVIQTTQLHVLRHFKRQTGQKNLCLSGGVALNCSANGVIRRSELFNQVFVQPAAGDDGTALGAALYAQRLHDPVFKRRKMTVPLWGPEFSDEEISKVVAHTGGSFKVLEKNSFDEVCQEVVARINEGQIVGWFQGRMEFGPRALGSRSILADPRDPGMREKINALVKKREGFRPFAPVVAREKAAEIFEVQPGQEDGYSHMLYVTHVRPAFRDKLPATTHVDGSARVQTVTHEQNPRLWKLLNEFGKLSGLPVLLNTSFNVRGQPIVGTPQEAIETFLDARLDVLVLGNTILVPNEVRTADVPNSHLSIEELEELATKHEEFWVNRLCSLEPVSLPYKRRETAGVRCPPFRVSGESLPLEGKENAGAKVATAGTVQMSVPKECLPAGIALNPETLVAAFGAFVARITGATGFDVDLGISKLINEIGPNSSAYAAWLPLRLEVDATQDFGALAKQVGAEIEKVRQHGTYSLDVGKRHPALQSIGDGAETGRLSLAVMMDGAQGNGQERKQNHQNEDAVASVLTRATELVLVIPEGRQDLTWVYREDVFDHSTVSEIANQFRDFLSTLAAEAGKPIARISLLSEADRRRVLQEWNDTRCEFPSLLMHEPFEAQARKTPEAIAVAFQDQQLSYRELNERAEEVAAHLRHLGIGPDSMVGLCAEVSLDMMAGLLGILKAGGAYVPLDPDFPKDRLAFMLEDSKIPVLLTQTVLRDGLPPTTAKIVCLDNLSLERSAGNGHKPAVENGSRIADHKSQSSNLAYVIYTSGSTGKPKGVMITHGNVANFYVAMDKVLGTEPGVWLGVTSISFDISVLELFWTLARGFKLVLQRKERARSGRAKASLGKETKQLDFSLFYFAADEGAGNRQKYRLLLEGAKFADDNGFAAVWTPERHFHAFGGLYPNPSVTSAAVAAITKRVQIRAGSVVAPLHNAVRIAEEWSVVDNLSNGRVGISFASGWQANDFVLAPENHARRKELMLEHLETVRRLWRGESVPLRGPKGDEVATRILPRPVQPELPIWLTASGNPDTFKLAGELGANVLTHLLGQSVAELQKKVEVYRAAWRAAGHPREGKVTLMLHSFVHKDAEVAKEAVRKPFTAYLRTSADLIRNDPWAFSTFKRPASARAEDRDLRTAKLSEEELDAMAEHAFERYFETSGLFGTPAHCLEITDRLRGIGIDEIGCLIDFGMPEEQVLAGLQDLAELRILAGENGSGPAKAGTPNLPEARDVSEEGAVNGEVDYSVPAQMALHAVTHLQCTPSLAAMLLEDPRALPGLRSLKKLLLGGEALPVSLVQQLEIPGEILNMYGPTETTIWSATQKVDRQEKIVPIGRPIANTEFYILDKELQPVPVGIPGELLIGGAGVVRGYLHRPDLSAEKFVPNPFKPGTSERLYRTGDLGRYLPDGRIEFLGRLDHQVKLRGYRIELGEIETALREHSSVKDCVAIVREDVPGDKRLVAYLVPAAGSEIEPRTLRQFLGSKLPDYMIPASFVPLTILPLTPNGKLDRKALPAPNAHESAPKSQAAPSSLSEVKISEVMCEVLGLKQIGVRDDFFELGGNSLLATQLIARLREAFQWELPLRLAFEFPTVESLARAIAEKFVDQPKGALAKHERISGAESDEEAPLSFAQQRIWFLHQLEPGPHYNDHFDLRVTGPLNVPVLEQAMNEIVKRHQTLRSTFSNQDGKPALAIAQTFSLKLPVTDLRGLPFEQREAEARRLAVADCQQPFDLEHGPLLRVGLVKISETDHLIILTFDHIVVDGWSHGVFLTELTALYEAFLAGKPSPLPELPIQYADYAAWQREWLQGEAIASHVHYWKQQLEAAPLVLDLPSDRPRPAGQSYRGARHFFPLDRALIGGLSDAGRKENSTLYMVLLAAFQSLLARYSGQTDIVIGSPVANRNRAETEPLIGSFMNTLALRGDLSGDPPFVEVLRRVRKVALEAYAHQELPFEKLVAELQPVRDLSYSPVFQVMFILQNTPSPTTRAGLVSFGHFDVDAGSSKMDLTLNIEETSEGAEAWIEYATDLFDHATIIRMAEDYHSILEGVCAEPRQKLSQFRLKGAAQRSVPNADSAWQTSRGRSVDLLADNQSATPVAKPEDVGETNGKGDSKSEVVREVTRIWSEVLGTEKIGLHDNLFDLGGHSLLITQIISRIRKSLRVEIPIHHFFEDPTVAVISRFIEKQLQEKPAGSAKASTGGNSFGEMRRRGAVGNPKL